MAKLTTPLQVQSSFPQQAQQYAATMERNKLREQREQKEKEAEAKQEAKTRGVLTAGVQGLQANPDMYAIGQQMYSDYMAAEDSGNTEDAENIKAQLAQFMNASSAYIKSEQNLLSGIINDPEKLSQFENSSKEIIAAAEANKQKGYSLKRENGQYVVANASGEQYGLFNIPELAGEGSFISALTPKQKIPNYVNATDFGEKHSRAILSRNDVVDDSGRIVNPGQIVNYISEEFDQEVRKNPEFLKGLVYDDQYVKGGMETFNEDSINNLIDDENYVRTIRDKYIQNAVSTVSAYEDVKETEEKDKRLVRVQDLPVHSSSNGLNAVEFAEAGKQLQYIREEGDKTIMANVLRIEAAEEGGIAVFDNTPVDANGNPVIDLSNAVAYKVNRRVVKPGDQEWDKVTSVFGGDKYMQELIKRLDPGLEM
jgi:hypothetical protein